MLCDECKKNPACVHVTKITNNQKVERHLCEQCAQSLGEMKVSLNTSFSVHDFLKGMFSHDFMEGNHFHNEAACPNCGMTYTDFSRGGKIGCGTCYQVFADRLEPLIRRIHGTCGHTGKVPKRTGGTIEVKQRLKRLRQELERYVAHEQYEQAAKVRDEIRSLEKQLGC
ncbi:uvrb/uvrc motif [Lucifera butyrica]|uniref:Uvrb/uvrc motif n=1 Tax=Lucifera butyrica TaxID=1351585 RepID=A0A498RAC7_9FIRM|nr:UvrB/UvrC motif-containing protein [Lucifera butyrica]VBB08494.1 uvrb/uvrc motif [Lucifera butyrica]